MSDDEVVLLPSFSDPSFRYINSRSYSGADIHATCYIPAALGYNRDGSQPKRTFKKFAELATITISSHRGVAPVRALGEHWVRDYTKGTRSFAGTMIFAVLEKDVFADLYQVDRRDNGCPFPAFVDQLPPFTICLSAINEFGHLATMALWEVTLTDWGMSLSVDDLFIETTYNYVAKWVTPFLKGNAANVLTLRDHHNPGGSIKAASDLLSSKRS